LLAANVRNERARQLLDVVWMSHLAEQIPLERVGLEGIQDHIAPRRVVENVEIRTVRVGDDCTITARKGAMQKRLDGRALARTGRTDDLEMLHLILRGHRDIGERD